MLGLVMWLTSANGTSASIKQAEAGKSLCIRACLLRMLPPPCVQLWMVSLRLKKHMKREAQKSQLSSLFQMSQASSRPPSPPQLNAAAWISPGETSKEPPTHRIVKKCRCCLKPWSSGVAGYTAIDNWSWRVLKEKGALGARVISIPWDSTLEIGRKDIWAALSCGGS